MLSTPYRYPQTVCYEYFTTFAVLLFHLIQFDWTLLHFAAYHGQLNLVKKLVTVCKFPPDAKTKVQVDCLHVC